MENDTDDHVGVPIVTPLANLNATPPFWIVWNSQGGNDQCQHTDPIAAETEAERLAQLNPGQEFYVLEPTCVLKCQNVEIKRFASNGWRRYAGMRKRN